MLGGFSMGSVMSYAMGLGADRPAVAGVLAFSGFVPTVEGWQPSARRPPGDTRAFIAHGRRDPIIEVGFARRARELLEAGGLEVDYRESDVGHQIDPVAPGRRHRLARRDAQRLSGRRRVRPGEAAGGGVSDGQVLVEAVAAVAGRLRRRRAATVKSFAPGRFLHLRFR